jgi:type I restriction enzyme, S subunit
VSESATVARPMAHVATQRRWILLGDHVENLDGRRVPVPAKERESRQGPFPYYGASGVIDRIDGFTHEGEVLLLGEDGANLLSRSKPIAFLATGKIWVNNHAHVLRCKSGHSNKYLAYYINSIDLTPYVTGTAQPKLSQGMMNKIPVPVVSVEEQHCIVAELEKQFSRLDEAVANLQRVKANLKRYKACVLKDAVEGQLVETEAEIAGHVGRHYESGERLQRRVLEARRLEGKSRSRAKEPIAPELAGMPALPDGWVWASIDQLAAAEASSITDGPFGSNLKSEHYVPAGPRVIRLQNIKDGEFADEYAHISAERFSQLRKHEVFAGDLVIASLGENPPRACVIPSSVGPAIVKADCIRFKPHPSVSAAYLNVALNCQPTRARVKDVLHGIGRPRLSLGEIRAIALPLPPEAEQHRIVAEVDRRLSIVREVEAEVDANLKRARALRQAVLSKAFGVTR